MFHAKLKYKIIELNLHNNQLNNLTSANLVTKVDLTSTFRFLMTDTRNHQIKSDYLASKAYFGTLFSKLLA